MPGQWLQHVQAQKGGAPAEAGSAVSPFKKHLIDSANHVAEHRAAKAAALNSGAEYLAAQAAHRRAVADNHVAAAEIRLKKAQARATIKEAKDQDPSVLRRREVVGKTVKGTTTVASTVGSGVKKAVKGLGSILFNRKGKAAEGQDIAIEQQAAAIPEALTQEEMHSGAQTHEDAPEAPTPRSIISDDRAPVDITPREIPKRDNAHRDVAPVDAAPEPPSESASIWKGFSLRRFFGGKEKQ